MSSIRDKADKIVHKALQDSSFREALKNNPEDVLKNEGIPDDLVEDLGQEISLDGETVIACSRTCRNTCWWTQITMA